MSSSGQLRTELRGVIYDEVFRGDILQYGRAEGIFTRSHTGLTLKDTLLLQITSIWPALEQLLQLCLIGRTLRLEVVALVDAADGDTGCGDDTGSQGVSTLVDRDTSLTQNAPGSSRRLASECLGLLGDLSSGLAVVRLASEVLGRGSGLDGGVADRRGGRAGGGFGLFEDSSWGVGCKLTRPGLKSDSFKSLTHCVSLVYRWLMLNANPT